MLVIKTDYLTDDMYDALTDLVLDVNEADGAKYAVPDDADYYAIAYEDGSSTVTVPEDADAEKLDPDMMRSVIAIYEMGETHEGMTVIELSAFTGPEFRQKGWFKTLFESIREELSAFAIRFAVYENDINKEALKSINAVHEHDELMMALTEEAVKKVAALSENMDMEAGIESERVDTEEGSFDEGRVETPYGECFFRVYGKNAYVYGILTYDSFLRRGFAYAMLLKLFKYFDDINVSEVTLEVSASNVPAVRLYEKLGFIVVDRLSYYYVVK